MMPQKQQKKKDDKAPADKKNARKKGNALIPGGTVGTGRSQLSSDSCNPDLDIDTAMQMTAQPLRFEKSAPSSKHSAVIYKPQSQRPLHPLTAAVAAAAAAAAEEPPKLPKAKKTRKKPPTTAPPSPLPPPTNPDPSDSNEDKSAEEDATGK